MSRDSEHKNVPEADSGFYSSEVPDEAKRLREQIGLLTEERALAMNALDMAAGLGAFKTSISKLQDPVVILQETAEKVASLVRFKGVAFYLVSEEDADFHLTHVWPQEAREVLTDAVEDAIEDKTFAWALTSPKPVSLLTHDKKHRLLLHAIATATRVRGMFAAVTDEAPGVVSDIANKLLSIILLSCANTLESYALYRYIQNINTDLQESVHKLAESEKELTAHKDRLEETVAERTQELTQERDFVATVLDTAGALIVVLDRDGTTVRFNKACEEATGYAAEDVVGKDHLSIFVPAAEQATVRETLAAIFGGASYIRGENHLLTRDGSMRRISWSNAPILDDDGKVEYAIASGIDITERHRAEEALRDSEARFRTIFMDAGVGIALLDVEGGYLDANPRFQAMTGYRGDLLQGLTVGETMHYEDAKVQLEKMKGMVAGRIVSAALEQRYLKRGGGVLWGQTTLTLVRDARGTPQYFVAMVEDVSERVWAERALREAEATYRNIFENAVEGIFQADAEGDYVKANPAMAKIFGYVTPDELLAMEANALDHLCRDAQKRETLWTVLGERGDIANFEITSNRADGTEIWISVSAHAAQGSQGEIQSIEGLVEDITERKRAEEYLERKATFDSLTNIPNRMLFTDRLEQNIAQARRQKLNLALLYMDLDEFKIVNDTHGHHVGDELLRLVAERLQERTRKSDTLARLGGDEFTLLLYNVERKEDAERVARSLIESLSHPYELSIGSCRIGVSVGIAFFPCDGENAGELMKKADAAMYRAKGRGKNTYHLYDASCTFR